MVGGALGGESRFKSNAKSDCNKIQINDQLWEINLPEGE